jgi:spore coat protein U-like protein
VTVTISLGTGSAGSYLPFRKMQGPSPSDTLNYNMYVDAAYAQVLGDGTGGTSNDIGSATISKNSPFTFTETIYGRIFSGQDPAVGAYSDPIVYTVNF